MYFSIKEPFHYETVIKKSRFICDLIPVNDAEEAKDALATIRKRYYDATHHCSALRLGTTGTLQEQSNDDGEPAGTAGRPMLHVLQQRDLTNLLAVVTRYFGGIKLGTGGLTRAYGGTLAESVSAAPIVAYVAHHAILSKSPTIFWARWKTPGKTCLTSLSIANLRITSASRWMYRQRRP